MATGVEQIQFWAATDVGRVRDHNEDNFLADRNVGLFAVADGMGGHAAGEVASSIAVRTVREHLGRYRDVVEKARVVRQESRNVEDVQREICSLLESAFQEASAAIWTKAQAEDDKRGMGTTLSVLLLGEAFAYVAHVGDSRIYLLRMGEVQQITDDHTLVNALIRDGRLSREEARDAPFKNAVTRAVGVYESVEVDTLVVPVLPGDQFLLASDGLTGYLDAAEIPPFMQSEDVKEIPPKLIEIANERGGHDNITSVVVRLVDFQGVAHERFRDLNFRIDALKNMPFFKYLSYSDLLRVFVNMRHERVAAGTTVFEQGSAGSDLYLILAGAVRIHRGDIDLATLGPGDHFGEMALIDQAPRSASVTAVQDTALLRLDRNTFFTLIRKESDLARKVLWNILQVLSARLRSTSSELEQARDSMVEEVPIDAVEVFGGSSPTVPSPPPRRTGPPGRGLP